MAERASVDTSVKLAGLHLSNPLLPGSGPPGDSLNKLKRLMKTGIGALVTKTISVELPVVHRPTMASDSDFFFNVEKWSEKSFQEWLTSILPALSDRTMPLVASLGYTPEDLEKLIPLFDSLVDGFEISTHYIAASESLLIDTIRRAKSVTKKPIFMKLSWHTGNIVANARACESGGADGITAINSIGPVLTIDANKRASRLGATEPYAWLSGPAIKPMALRAVYDVSRNVQIPVVACGGMSTGIDVVEFMLAGATAVESCTSLIRKGPELVDQAMGEIINWCEEHGVTTLSTIIGTLTPHFKK